MSTNRHDVAEACARLRQVLDETRGMGRREFLKALGAVASGSALISTLVGAATGRAMANEPPVTAFVFGGAWKRAAMTAFGDPFTAKTGIPMRYQEPYSFARVRAMHEAKAQQIDVFSSNGAETI